MSGLTATSKGAATREAILERAYAIACASGVEGLSIAPLAEAVGMSKSGVFAHFGSREGLQLAVLDSAAERFGEAVLVAAVAHPRGLPRLRALMRNWFEWVRTSAGGCVLLGAAMEYDDRRGPLRDRVLHNDRRWRAALRRAVDLAVEAGHLRAGDGDQRVFELFAIALGVHHDAGLYGYDLARRHGEAAFEGWVAANAATTDSPD
jgi:AcrR family transcriptional regulator